MLVKKYCVYVHRRKDNNEPFYIGCCSRNDSCRNTGIKKYRRAFDFLQRRKRWLEIKKQAGGILVEIAFTSNDKELAFEKEKQLIDFYGREVFENGLLANECLGGKGAPGQFNSFETRRKKSINQQGKNNSMYGKRGSETGTAKKVINTSSGKIYESISDAATSCEYNVKTLYNWLSGHRKNPTQLRIL